PDPHRAEELGPSALDEAVDHNVLRSRLAGHRLPPALLADQPGRSFPEVDAIPRDVLDDAALDAAAMRPRTERNSRHPAMSDPATHKGTIFGPLESDGGREHRHCAPGVAFRCAGGVALGASYRPLIAAAVLVNGGLQAGIACCR